MKFLPRLDSFVMPSKSKKKASLRLPAKNVRSPARTMLGVAPDDSLMIFVPAASGESGLSACRRIDVDVWRPSAASRRSAGVTFAWIVGHQSSPLGLAHALLQGSPGHFTWTCMR